MCYLGRMADFHDLIALMREPGDDGLPETIYDDLTASYNLAVDGGAAGITERDVTIAERDAEIARLKAINFDLLMAASVADEATDETDDNANDNPTEPFVDPISDLFN